MSRLNMDHLNAVFPLDPPLPGGSPGLDHDVAGSFDEHLQRARDSAVERSSSDRAETDAGPPPAPSERSRPEDQRATGASSDSDRPVASSQADQAADHPEPKAASDESDSNSDGKTNGPKTGNSADEDRQRNKHPCEDECEGVTPPVVTGPEVNAGSSVELIVAGGPEAANEAVNGEKSHKPRAVDPKHPKNPTASGNQLPAPAQLPVAEVENAPANPEVADPAAMPGENLKQGGEKSTKAVVEKSARPVSPPDVIAASAEAGTAAGVAEPKENAPIAESSGAVIAPPSSEPISQPAGNNRRSVSRQTGKVAAHRLPEETPPQPTSQDDDEASRQAWEPKAAAELPKLPQPASANEHHASPKTAPSHDSRPEAAAPARSLDAQEPRAASGVGEPTSPGAEQVDRVRFAQRVAHAFAAARDRGGSIRLRLHPPELGSLRIELTVHNGLMRAKMEAETPAAHSALLDSLPVLRDRLAEQQIKVERFDIDLMDPSAGGSSQQPADQPQPEVRAAGGARGRRESTAEISPAPRTASSRAEGTGFDVTI